MDDFETGQVKTHIIIFITMIAMYVLGLIPTDKFDTALLTYIAIMTGAIYFKINRDGKRKGTGKADGNASSGH